MSDAPVAFDWKRNRLPLLAFLCLLMTPLSATAGWWEDLIGVSVSLETTIERQPTDEEPGPVLVNGDPVVWSFTITNSGEGEIAGATLYERQLWGGFFPYYEAICELESIAPGDRASCEKEGVVQDGQQSISTQVVARGAGFWRRASASNEGYYYGVPGYPDLGATILLNGEPTGREPGPSVTEGEEGQFDYQLENTSQVTIENLRVTHGGLEDESVEICRIEALIPAETATCSYAVTVTDGSHVTEVGITGDGPVGLTLDKTVAAYYVGVAEDELTAMPKAVPQSGQAPLQVTFSPDVITSNAIERYEWDFQGDGTFERSETVGRNQSFTYRNAGEYQATLRVTDNLGEQETGSITITVGNALPVITTAEASPSTGESPLVVNFTVAAMDSDGITTVELDSEGDGTFDHSQTVSGTSVNVNLQQAYEQPGTFNPVVRVVDGQGGATVATFPTLEVRALEEGSPSVDLSLSPVSGDVPLDVTLSASASDPDGLGMTRWDWDLDGDGQFDQQTTEPGISHRYESPGTFYPRVRVTAEDGESAEDVAKLVTQAELELDVSTDTIDTALDESTTITTSVTGTTRVSLRIERTDGSSVVTLVPWVERQAGSYSDTWDGRDSNGNIVQEGEYRAVLLYEIDGEIHRFDLATSTGGTQYNPSRSSIPSSFAPIAGEPLEITFTLDRASEVTSFMGLYNVNTRLVTFHQRVPLGRGTHRILWNGEDDNGKTIDLPSGESFLFGIWGWTLPDNAIYVRSGAHISGLTVTPRVLVPSSRPDETSNKFSVATFNLSKAASVNLTVDNADTGVRVYEERVADLEAGEQSVTWDGYNDARERVAPGVYRIGITPIGENDFRSTTRYSLQQVYY
ncbi:PKD domain-containing protein [Alcanivorax sp. 521-1]|uniref:PKD domain-containing protein n=1 Tax=Alloalcanivorax profundimaris TaxID=2735259 RepID=A0ABS0ARQ8_9GAMM|nr:PKD domain-containing protein [Alloalcanivorax profundimaris]MBF5056817.1 PKD domain-containing protein [Alloalcanivorax profundimaris]